MISWDALVNSLSRGRNVMFLMRTMYWYVLCQNLEFDYICAPEVWASEHRSPRGFFLVQEPHKLISSECCRVRASRV